MRKAIYTQLKNSSENNLTQLMEKLDSLSKDKMFISFILTELENRKVEVLENSAVSDAGARAVALQMVELKDLFCSGASYIRNVLERKQVSKEVKKEVDTEELMKKIRG